MSKNEKYIVGTIAAIVIVALFFACTHVGRAIYNMRVYSVKKVDDATSYTTRKEVEDSCRAMIASYTSDYMVWNQLHESEDGFERSVATQVKIRCNKTAATYNEYVLKNSYVWNGNVPDDISDELAYIP